MSPCSMVSRSRPLRALAGHVGNDAFANERVDEGTAQAPELGVRVDRRPTADDDVPGLAVLAGDLVLPGVGQSFGRGGLDEVVGLSIRILDLPEHTENFDGQAGLFSSFPHGRLFDGLALLDPSAGEDRRVLRLAGHVEHEQLVGARQRVLARYVDGDGRAEPQLDSALSFAL